MNKTVYIIGAGASQEVRLPTGDELKNAISSLLNIHFGGSKPASGDITIKDALHLLSQKESGLLRSYVDAAWLIRDAMPQAISIDSFIDDHSDNDKIAICGKLAIVRSILKAEKNSLLSFTTHTAHTLIDFASLDETWYSPFFQLLRENCSKDDLEDRFQSIVLIIFNYDRCVEHFMYHSLQNYYRISGDKAAELVDNMNIYHPYGSVGSLPWSGKDDSMEFGCEPSAKQLLQFFDRIKTFTEETAPDSSEISEIRNHMGEAQRLVFLGFAFHKLNMELITSAETPGSHTWQRKCYATTYGFSKSDTNAIQQQIIRLYSLKSVGAVRTETADLTCAAFFKEFSMSLVF